MSFYYEIVAVRGTGLTIYIYIYAYVEPFFFFVLDSRFEIVRETLSRRVGPSKTEVFKHELYVSPIRRRIY